MCGDFFLNISGTKISEVNVQVQLEEKKMKIFV